MSSTTDPLMDREIVPKSTAFDALRANIAANLDAMKSQIGSLASGVAGNASKLDQLSMLLQQNADRISKIEASLTNIALLESMLSDKVFATKFYIPLYNSSLYKNVIALAQKYKWLKFIVAVNPCNGPGPAYRQDIYDKIIALKTCTNVSVLMYFPTNYARQTPIAPNACNPTGDTTMPYLKQMIDNAKAWYPMLDGGQYDECMNSLGTLPFYTELINYARTPNPAGVSLKFAKGNFGAPTPEAFLALFDCCDVGEGQTLPTEADLQQRTFAGKYPEHKFGLAYFAQAAPLNTQWITMAKRYCGCIYLTDDVLSNPYDTLPTYADPLCQALLS